MTLQSPAAEIRQISVRCCVVGGGPAGMVLGFLLARSGIDVVVLEKHGDFLRDFRGDTIHPSTLELMSELGMLDEFLQLPHQEVREIRIVVGGEEVRFADTTHLPTRCKFVAMMPQWEFLNFIEQHGKKYPTFKLLMNTEATGLIEEGGRVVGVRANSPDGPLEVRSHLVVGADGRHSTMRQSANLVVEDLGAPIDVLWMRLSRPPTDPRQVMARVDKGRFLVMLDRQDYWQCGYVIHKGGYEEIRNRGLEAFRSELVQIAPFLKERVGELKDWDQIRLLTVSVDRLKRWYRPGILCIGDSAHAMSPVGGVGINLAIQDAVATANYLARPLHDRNVNEADLQRVQDRRAEAAARTQRFQVFVHRRLLSRIIGSDKPIKLPWYLRFLLSIPWVRRIPARVVGIGFQPERIELAEGAFKG